jgi:hypothetical protein
VIFGLCPHHGIRGVVIDETPEHLRADHALAQVFELAGEGVVEPFQGTANPPRALADSKMELVIRFA